MTGTETTDDQGTTFPTTGPMTYRLGSDSPWDVVSQACQRHIDILWDPEGRTLRPFVKGTVGDASGLTLISGYSDAGIADPDSVNIDDLQWDRPRAEFDALIVRWAWPVHEGFRVTVRDARPRSDREPGGCRVDRGRPVDGGGGAGEPATFSVLNPSEVPLPHDTLAVPGPFDVNESETLPVTGDDLR